MDVLVLPLKMISRAEPEERQQAAAGQQCDVLRVRYTAQITQDFMLDWQGW